MKYFIATGIIIILSLSQINIANAQVGFAISEDENDSAVAWQWAVDESTSRATARARNLLQEKGYTNITVQPCNDCGFTLSSGYWVVVQSDYEIYDGSIKRGFGLGISAYSYSEAERYAVDNLSQYNWSWSARKHNYTISDQGQF